MKWFSSKTNPAAVFLPQFISKEEEGLLVRSLQGASTKTDNRGSSSGPIVLTDSNRAFFFRHQLVVLSTLIDLKTKDLQGSMLIRLANERIADAKSQPELNKLPTWRGGRDHKWKESNWVAWWKKTAALPHAKRKLEVISFKSKHLSRPYGNTVFSSIIGRYPRDGKNPWTKESSWNRRNNYDWSRVLPIVKRIDEAFRLVLPDRYDIQRSYVERIHPDFRIQDTVFTTITVNSNYKTSAHRDDNNLRQGFSNLLVLGHGSPYKGGHLILPEFGVEFPLKPRDLLFVQNDEYIHSNTAIIAKDATSTRMSLVLYVKESMLFSGTPEFESHRKNFFELNKAKKTGKVRGRLFESKAWYRHLENAVGGSGRFISAARESKLLNLECLYNYFKWTNDPLFESKKYNYLCEFSQPPAIEFSAYKSLFSVAHFKTARQDRVLEKGATTREHSQDGLKRVDTVFIGHFEGERWGISHLTSESGALLFNNNRFNPQAVARLPSLPTQIEKLSSNAFDWLCARWRENKRVFLVEVPTGIEEAPYRVAFTTVAVHECANLGVQRRIAESKKACYEAATSIHIRSLPSTLGFTNEIFDLGYRSYPQIHGALKKEGGTYTLCDAISIRFPSERKYLNNHLHHYVRRAKAIGGEDYRSRSELVGIFSTGTMSKFTLADLSKPFRWRATSRALLLSQGTKEIAFSSVKSLANWRADVLSAPFLAVHLPHHYVKLWAHKKPNGQTGQITISDDSHFYMFQAISRVGFIGADEVSVYSEKGSKRKIVRPSRVLHAQRRNNVQPLTSALLKRIERLPYHHVSAIPKTETQRALALESYQIAIPSYGRSNMIARFTLKMLERYGVDPKRVTIFVADAVTNKLWVEEKIKGKSKPDDALKFEFEERDDGSRKKKVWVRRSKELEQDSDAVLYKNRLLGNPYGGRIVVGVKGIGPQRNFIQNYYPEGTHLLSIDDDLSGLFELLLNHKKTRSGGVRDEGVDVKGNKFNKIIQQSFSECHRTGSHLFGFFASSERNQSVALRRTEIETNLCYIIASMYGKIIRHNRDLEVRLLNHGEDQERTLRFRAKDGITLRLNKYSVNKGTVYLSLGGIQQARKDVSTAKVRGEARFKAEMRSLEQEFQQYCHAKVPAGKDTYELDWRPRREPQRF